MTADTTTTGPTRRDGALHFPLQEGERVILVCRRHWIYLWPNIAFQAALALAPVIVIGILLRITDHFDGAAARIFWIATVVYLLFWAVRIFFAWYRYNNDIWVVTDQRVIDSVKTTPFNLKMSTADLVNIQDMTVERNGIVRTMFDYGDIICQTAAEQQEFLLAGIPHPGAVQALVDRERDRERTGGRG